MENATQVETSAQRTRIETGFLRIDTETLTQQDRRQKKKLTGVRLALEFESVQGLLVLTREKTAGRFGHRRVVARIDLNLRAAHESRALVVPTKRVVSRKTVEPENLATRCGRGALGKLEQLEAKAARLAPCGDAMDIAGCLSSAGPKQYVAPLQREGSNRATIASCDVHLAARDVTRNQIARKSVGR